MDLNGENREVLYVDGTDEKVTAGDGGLYIMRKQQLFYVDYETKDERLLWDGSVEYDCNFMLYSDGEYVYLVATDEYGYQMDNDCLLILDKEGMLLETMTVPNMKQLIREYKAENDVTDSSVSYALDHTCYSITPFVGSTSKYVFAADGFFAGYYIDKDDIGSENCEWKEAQTEE